MAELIEELVSEALDLKAGAHKGISDLGDGIPDNLTVLEDDHVHDFLFAVLDEGVRELGQGLAAGRAEEHPSHSHGLVTVVNCASNKRDVDASATEEGRILAVLEGRLHGVAIECV